MRTFLRNTARGGLALAIAAVMIEEAMLNMEHSHALWRLDNPLPWIAATPFLITAVYYFFASDKDTKETKHASKR
jgi:hypothetical protein